ncbi:MAG: hypothetical protein HY265_01900 [Deltaproteobacteria bacterium]|nr:hypothetical protein [Deltaproteobacteria bacterium]
MGMTMLIAITIGFLINLLKSLSSTAKKRVMSFHSIGKAKGKVKILDDHQRLGNESKSGWNVKSKRSLAQTSNVI